MSPGAETALAEEAAEYVVPTATTHVREATLTAAWLLGRVPSSALPLPVLRAGRAGRGPGPDVREATLLLPSGVTRTGDVEVHLRASDFVRHGHAGDHAYGNVILHLVWEDDRPEPQRGTETPHAGGGAPTVAVAAAFAHDLARLEAAVARGPGGDDAHREPCADATARLGIDEAGATVRREGQRRLAERAWRAGRLADRLDWDEAWQELLDHALIATAGRVRESDERRAESRAWIAQRLGVEPLAALADVARVGSAAFLIEAVRPPGMGAARAAEIAWNAALPLLIAYAAAYDDLDLARATAALAAAWPAPRPYGRTRTLARLAGPAPARSGALYAQGLLHLQDVWCTRGGCGACPLSARAEESAN